MPPRPRLARRLCELTPSKFAALVVRAPTEVSVGPPAVPVPPARPRLRLAKDRGCGTAAMVLGTAASASAHPRGGDASGRFAVAC